MKRNYFGVRAYLFKIVTVSIFSLLSWAVSGDALSQNRQDAPGTVMVQLAQVQTEGRALNATQWLAQNNLSVTRNVEQGFINNYIVVEGEGLPSSDSRSIAQKRLTAERAAVVVAYRQLAEFMAGVTLISNTMVKDCELRYDEIKSAVQGFVRGAEIIFKEYNEKEEVARAVVKVGIKGPQGFGGLMYEKLLKNPRIRAAVVEEKPTYAPIVQVSAGEPKPVMTEPRPVVAEPKPVSTEPAQGASVAKPVMPEEIFDGLVVDATGHNFKPALINRIFTLKGEALYDPSKVDQKILVENGCAEYANSVDKAKSALQARGTKNPLIVKATGTASPADLQVSDDDAVKIFSVNQKADFFAAAKVAFVLK
jgi:hypothetical protein